MTNIKFAEIFLPNSLCGLLVLNAKQPFSSLMLSLILAIELVFMKPLDAPNS